MAQIPFDVVIWDFDGTLVNSLPATFAAFNAGLKPFLGRELSPREIMTHFGPPDQLILRKLVGDANADECYRLMLDHMKANISLIQAFEGVVDALADVQALGARNAIFTGRGRVSTDVILKELDFARHFIEVITNDDVERHKPHPEGILKICAKAGVPVERALMVGDSNADVSAGRDAGCRTVGITWSEHAATFRGFEKRPDFIAASPTDLVRWLRGFVRV